jgi:hypothetical protein
MDMLLIENRIAILLEDGEFIGFRFPHFIGGILVHWIFVNGKQTKYLARVVFSPGRKRR